MDDYDDIQKRLSPLNEVNMPAESEQRIAEVIREASQAYQQKKHEPTRGRMQKWVGGASVVAAVAVAAVAVIMVLHTRLPEKTINTSATKNTSSNTTATSSTVPITYTHKHLTNVRTVSKSVGVNAWIPSRGLPGDTLTTVKGGSNELILNYEHIWVVESNQVLAKPYYSITRQQTVDVSGTPGTFIVADNNTSLFFRKGSTYIKVENLIDGAAISLTTLQSIAESFQPVR